LYIERDGAFVLDAEGAVEKAKLDEFRVNNVALIKQLDDLKKKFEGIDPEKVRELEAGDQTLSCGSCCGERLGSRNYVLDITGQSSLMTR